MAGATILMNADKQYSLQEIHEKIHYIKGAEQISKSVQTIHDVLVWTLAYEKYFFRAGGYATLTVTLTEYGQEQTACIVAAGGGAGIINHSFGANRGFAKDCVEVLKSCGFALVKSDLDQNGKGFAERFLK